MVEIALAFLAGLTARFWFAFGRHLYKRWLAWRNREKAALVVDYGRIPFPRAATEMARVWPWHGIKVRLESLDGVRQKLEARWMR